ncbi:MAG: CotH kinase family protein [Dysgonamonadaceae bacterium]|jgi:hypothetical protein|nr:CotH kinase family protein [Dysgonamonadaceae bacterium]
MCKKNHKQLKYHLSVNATAVALCFILLSFFSSCSKDQPGESLSSDARLESFSFSPTLNSGIETTVVGLIWKNEVNLSMPYTASLNKLIATFSFQGKSVMVGNVEQVSGVTQNDFSNPVTYTVVAEDGTKTNYTVIAAKSSAAEFETFSFTPTLNGELEKIAAGSIQDQDVSLSIPYAASPNNLIANFTFKGRSVMIGNVEQVSGVTANNFSSPVTYTIVAEDGSKKDYRVSVSKDLKRLPRLYLTTDGGAEILDKENYVSSTIEMKDLDSYYSNVVSFTARTGVRGRGNSTWGMPKKPYRMKLDSKASILGLPSDKDWALLANYTDKTLLRNITAFEMARIAGMSWTPASYSIDFYKNNVYQGVYSFTEHVKVAKDRLNMDLVGSSDVAGNYFLELDFHYDEPYKFKTDKKELPMMFKDPDTPNDAQFNYVKDFFNTAEQTLYSDNFTDATNGYRKYIDVPSFINYYIVQELAKNVDGNMRGSCYMAIRNGKIEMPLVWDFDIAFGNAEHITWEQGASSVGPDGWYIKTCSPWFDRFFEDPSFVSELKARWNALKPQLDQIPNFIKDKAASLNEAQQRNFGSKASGGAGWDINEVMWPNYIDRGTYSAEINYLVDFVEKRLVWLNTNINGL